MFFRRQTFFRKHALFQNNALFQKQVLFSFIMLAAVSVPGLARAEMSSVKVATQIGLPYLPLIVMQHDKLWEAEAKKQGLDLTVEYARLGGGAPLNDALLSDSVQIASAGLAPLLTLWDRTRSNYKVKALSAINASPMFLLTNKPNIKSIKDFGPDDRIALPSIRVSIQAIVLAMGVEQAYWTRQGRGARQHPGRDGPPRSLRRVDLRCRRRHRIHGEFAVPGTRTETAEYPPKSPNSFGIQGGPATLSVIYAKSDFVDKNPKLVAAFMAAQKQAIAMIKSDLKGSIDKYYAVTKDKTDRAIVEEILSGPNYDFDIFPKESMKIADFMVKTGTLRQKPDSWKDYFFTTVHGEPGT